MKTNCVHYKDARDMKEVDDASVRLIVTSPPYFNIKDYSKDGFQKKQLSEKKSGQIGDLSSYEEYLSALDEVWSECIRVLVPNGKLCINVPLMPIEKSQLNTHYNRDILDLNAGIQNHLLTNFAGQIHLMDLYIWERTNPTKKLMFGSYPFPANFYAQNTIEFIAVYVKEGIPIPAENGQKEASKLTEREWVEFTRQIWRIPVPSKSDPAYGLHPAIMPDDIVYRLIRLFSFDGDIVLDPFLGSGTTARVAKHTGRKYIGYEINPSYRSTIQRKMMVQASISELLEPGSLSDDSSRDTDFKNFIKELEEYRGKEEAV